MILVSETLEWIFVNGTDILKKWNNIINFLTLPCESVMCDIYVQGMWFQYIHFLKKIMAFDLLLLTIYLAYNILL